METTDAPKRRIVLGDHQVWPLLIGVALAVVIAVNAAFIWIAVNGADEVDASYVAGER